MLKFSIILSVSVVGIFCLSPPRIPRPTSDCNEEVENPKFYQESCSNDTECFGGPSSMVCKDKKCDCAENFLPEERFTGEKAVQTVCVPAPSLFSECNSTCQKPGVCQPYTGEGSDGKTKICQCAQPFQFENGVCYMTCKKDEVYDSSKYKCVKRCKVNEVMVNDTCKPLVGLSGQCESHMQCQAPFSECKSKICACRPGFTVANSICAPQTVSCPFGDALKNGNAFVKCRILAADDDSSEDDDGDDAKASGRKKSIPRPPGKKQDDCAKGSFCMVPSGDYYRRPNSSGFCCPERPAACPVGAPHPTAKCDSNPGGKASENCPWETHFCQNSGTGGPTNEKQLCCSKSCASEFVQVNDKCLPMVNLGGACSTKEQCSTSYTDCVAGVCKCQAGAKESGNPSYKYCSVECAEGEVVRDGKCLKLSKLADTCTTKRDFLCPEYGRCSSAKQCVCRCGAFTLADNVCAPPPICRPPIVFPIFVGDFAQAKAAPSLPPIPRISDEEREKLLKNVTFCKVNGKNPPAGLKISAKCKDKEYCSQYITNVGLCCPKPEPFCPMGGEPNKGKVCDPKNPISCGLKNSCFKYLYGVDQGEDSKDYTVCCPKSPSHVQPRFLG